MDMSLPTCCHCPWNLTELAVLVGGSLVLVALTSFPCGSPRAWVQIVGAVTSGVAWFAVLLAVFALWRFGIVLSFDHEAKFGGEPTPGVTTAVALAWLALAFALWFGVARWRVRRR